MVGVTGLTGLSKSLLNVLEDNPLALLPGDDQPDAELSTLSTLGSQACHKLWQYCVHGGPFNAQHFLNFADLS